MTVRSTRLGVLASSAAGYSNIFTPPSGWRAIVKAIEIYNGNAVQQHGTVYIQNSSGSVLVHLLDGDIASGQQIQWTGWNVMNPTDQLNTYASAASLQFWVSGTLLQLTGGEPM